MGMSTIVRAEK